MFNEFLTALLHKIIQFLVSHQDFFEVKREKLLEDLSVPTAFKDYLSEVSEKDFLHDLAIITTFLEDPKGVNMRNNEFFKSFLTFLTTDLARKIDYLDGNFYLLKTHEKALVVDKLIKGDSLLAQTLKMILINYNYQQIAEEIFNLGSKVKKTPYIVVQSPREIDPELKKEIRNHLTETYPLSFPVFQINRKLIGGLRIFEDGKTVDHSWLSRVLRFTSLTAN